MKLALHSSTVAQDWQHEGSAGRIISSPLTHLPLDQAVPRAHAHGQRGDEVGRGQRGGRVRQAAGGGEAPGGVGARQLPPNVAARRALVTNDRENT